MAEAEDDALEYDWGGDGSDLTKTVRAHVEAALVPATGAYPPPLDELLRLGDPLERVDIDARIAEIGFTQEHVPELVRMTRDRALNTAPDDSDEAWAPIHALTALSHLDLGEHAAELVPLFDVDSEWFGEELPLVLKNVGASALEPLQAYVQDSSRWVYGRAYAISAVEEIAKAHPEVREQAVQLLSETLTHASENDPYVNADLVSALVQLHAVEALPVIRQAFEQDAVDESIMGDWTAVLKALGQKVDQDDPLVQRSRQRWNEQKAELRGTLPPSLRGPDGPFAPAAPRRDNAAKRKNKRKQSAASRKANKKKKRK
jgi:Protein of unknown function (DUF1186)